jgi:hypothetical protein
MEIEIDFNAEIREQIEDQIQFIREEFDALFGNHNEYTEKDKALAAQLLNYLSKIIDQPICLDFLSKTLQNLEEKYPCLF